MPVAIVPAEALVTVGGHSGKVMADQIIGLDKVHLMSRLAAPNKATCRRLKTRFDCILLCPRRSFTLRHGAKLIRVISARDMHRKERAALLPLISDEPQPEC